MSKSEFLKKMLAVGLSVMSCVPAVGATGSYNEEQSKIQIKKKSNIKKVLVAGAVGTGVVITAGVALHKLLSSKNTEKQNNQEIKSEKSNIQNQNSGKPEQVEVNTTNQDKKEPKPEKKVTPSQDKKKPEVKKKVTPSQDKKEPEVKKKVTPSQDKKEPKPEKKDTPDQDWEKSKIMVQAGALACEAYSVKSIRDYIKGFPKGDAFMDAMKYMFEVFEGRERLDSINVKKNLSIISYYIKEKSGELKRIFKKIGSDNRLILSFNENTKENKNHGIA